MKVLAAFLISLSMCMGAYGQRAANRSRHALPLPVNQSFDASLEKLPPLFSGHDIYAVSKAVASQITAKGEYETTAQYQARLSQAKETFGQKLYAFILETSSILEPKIGYDADGERILVELDRGSVSYSSGRDINIKTDYQTERSVGSNAFGVKRVITTLYGKEFYLRYTNEISTYFILPMSSQEARRIKPLIGLLFVCRVVEDDQGRLMSTSPSFKDATIDSPGFVG
jgi:hypothetical protein